MVPSAKSWQRVREKLRQMTRCWVKLPLDELIGRLNRFLRGWRNYFSIGYPGLAFRTVNWFVPGRLRRFLMTRSQRRGRYLPGPSR